MTTIREVDNLGENYGAFYETKRWDVVEDGAPIGQIWRAKRSVDGVICWMITPAAIQQSFPVSDVSLGYGRTTKKGAIQEVIDWHVNARFNYLVGDWKLHCYHVWTALDHHLSNEQSRRYYAINESANRSKWISLSYIDEERKELLMMGGRGWHASGRRGERTVIVHQAETVEEALDTLIAAIGREPSPDDYRPPHIDSSLSVERHFGTLSTSMKP